MNYVIIRVVFSVQTTWISRSDERRNFMHRVDYAPYSRSPKSTWPDFVFTNPDGSIALVVEAKNRLNSSRRWAAEMRRNMHAHGAWPHTAHFLLALPDKFYLWRDNANAPGMVIPDYELDATFALGPFFQRFGISPENMSAETFELVVGSWLEDLRLGGLVPAGPYQEWLVVTGLQHIIQEGSVSQPLSL